jgi:hypothetical protein
MTLFDYFAMLQQRGLQVPTRPGPVGLLSDELVGGSGLGLKANMPAGANWS